jgi:polyphosphate kinase
MVDTVNHDELNSMSVEEAFLSLFEAQDVVPPRLFDPAHALVEASDSSIGVEQRVAALGIMSRDTESIFREYLSPFSVVGDTPDTASGEWPIALARWTELLHHRANHLLESEILPELARRGFELLTIAQAEADHGDWVYEHFQEHIYPLLTPLAVDPGRPFPYISSDSLNLLVELRSGTNRDLAALRARVKIPSITPRLLSLPETEPHTDGVSEGRPPAKLIWTIDLVRYHIDELFVGLPIRRIHCFRVLRAPHVSGASRPRTVEVQGRKARGSVVRVDVESDMPTVLLDWLVDHLDVVSYSVVRYDTPDVGMSLPQLADAVHNWAES